MVKTLPDDPRSPSIEVSTVEVPGIDSFDLFFIHFASITKCIPSDSVMSFSPELSNTVNYLVNLMNLKQVSRTPIHIETREKQRRPVAMRPSRLTQLESSSSSSNSEDSTSSDVPDPRSPTSKVPRTPLEDKEHGEWHVKKLRWSLVESS